MAKYNSSEKKPKHLKKTDQPTGRSYSDRSTGRSYPDGTTTYLPDEGVGKITFSDGSSILTDGDHIIFTDN